MATFAHNGEVNIGLPLVKARDIHLRFFHNERYLSYESETRLKFTYLKVNSRIPGTNDLTILLSIPTGDIPVQFRAHRYPNMVLDISRNTIDSANRLCCLKFNFDKKDFVQHLLTLFTLDAKISPNLTAR